MISTKMLMWTLLFVICSCVRVECRSYNSGLIFYNLENHNSYLPPTISVSRGRGLSKFKYSARGSIWSTFGRPCTCEGPLCGCCVGIKVKQFNFDQKMCANVSYAPPKDEIQLEVFFNETSTAKYGISARNPSPLCVPIMMGIPMSMCIQMSNIAVQGDNLNMCMDFLVRLASTELFEMHFQCMKVGLQGASWVGADGQPVIPANEGKIKDKSATDSEEYYDESEAEQENEIISKESDEEDSAASEQQKDDVNKAEEEMDYNDITEKLKDIVKEEQEAFKENDESFKENKTKGVLQNNNKVEEIVTNIMESLNQANAAEQMAGVLEMTHPMESIKNEINDIEELNGLSDMQSSEEAETNKVEVLEEDMEIKPLQSVTQTLKNSTNEASMEVNEEINEIEEYGLKTSLEESAEQGVNPENHIKKNNETESSESFSGDEIHLIDLLKDPHSQELIKESNDLSMTAAEQNESVNNKKPVIIVEEFTSEHIADLNDQEYAAMDKIEMLINTNDAKEINKNVNELNTTLEILQQKAETTTEYLMAADAAVGEISKFNAIDNALTTAAIMTTTTTTTTTTAKTTTPKAAGPATFIAKTEGVDKHQNADDDDQDEDNENSDGDGDGDGDDDNSHENDSDYDDEESEETDDDTKETEIVYANNATAIVMPNAGKLNNNKNGNKHKEPSTNLEMANESYSNESHSNENTNDDFETEEEEFEENGIDREAEESNEHNDSEEEYEDDETTAATNLVTLALADKRVKNNYDNCCKPTISTTFNNSTANTISKLNDYNYKAKIPQIDTASSNNLQFVSNNNSMISKTDNSSDTKSTTNDMSPATTINAARISATASNILMPLPLARKLYSLQHQHHQQYYQRSRQH